MARMRKTKKASKDFERSMLPQTRRAVFFDVLKLQWRKLLLASFILLVSALPLLLIAIFHVLNLRELPKSPTECLGQDVDKLSEFCLQWHSRS